MAEPSGREPVQLREITDANRDLVVALRVAPGQELFVASVAESLDEAATTPEGNPWYRAIYAGEAPIGFVMISWAVTPSEGIFGPWFLWRLLIDERHQRRGIGWATLVLITDLIRANGATELLTSYHPGDGEPWPFYQQFGFRPTGAVHEGEILLSLDLQGPAGLPRSASQEAP
jgi:diamine N-acetyltransferase